MNVLEGKVSVVTGGRRGIGFGIVSRFLAEGASVIVADPGEAPEALRLLQAEHSGRLLHVRADVTDEEQVAALFTTVEERFSQLDVLVNNAGVEFYKPVTTTSLAEWNGLMDVNLGGVFLCYRQAMRLLEATRGNIVNISSELALVGERNVAAYCASKGAILSLTRAMAVDHADLGIRVNSLCPGPIETDLLRDVIAASENPEGLLADFERRILLNRLGRVEEVVAAALFLASDQASFVTGSTLVVDGGWTAH